MAENVRADMKPDHTICSKCGAVRPDSTPTIARPSSGKATLQDAEATEQRAQELQMAKDIHTIRNVALLCAWLLVAAIVIGLLAWMVRLA